MPLKEIAVEDPQQLCPNKNKHKMNLVSKCTVT